MAEQIGLEAVFDLSSWSKNIGRYQSDTAKATGATSKAAGSIGKSWNQLGTTVGNVAKTMGVAIVAAGAAAGAAITGFAVSGIKQAADLEEQMSNIAAIFNTTAEGVAPLQELILELGVDPQLKVSTMEAAEAIEMLGKNGLTMSQIMDGAARSTVLLANATGADFGLAADIATDAMAVFNIEAKDMEQAVNGITAVTVASKFTIDDYRLALAQGGGVASAVGMEFEDFNTTIAAISPLFGSGSDAGTSLKTALLRLIPASSAAESAMSDLGLLTLDSSRAMELLKNAGITPVNDEFHTVIRTLQDYFATAHNVDLMTEEGAEKWQKWAVEVGVAANQFFDANGNLKDMGEITVVLNKALEGLSEEQRSAALNTIFGTDAMRAAVGMAQAGEVAYADAATAAAALGVSVDEAARFAEGGITKFEALQLTMGQTDAAQQAATRMDNFKGALEILGGVIETLQIQIGQAFLPMLTEITRAFTELVEQNSDKIVGFFTTLADIIIGVVGVFSQLVTEGELLSATEFGLTGATAALVDQFVAFALVVSDTLAGALSFVQAHMDAFKGALLAIAAVMAAATITAGITAMAGAIASLFNPITLIILAAAGLGIAWNTNFLGIRDITMSVVESVQQQLGPLLETLQTLGGGILTTIRDHWQEIAAGIGGFAAVLAIANIPAAFAAISAAVTGAGTVIGATLAAINLPLLAVAGVVALLAAAWVGNWFGMRDATVAAWESIKATFEPMTTAIQEFGSGALTEIQNFVAGNETEFTNLQAIWAGTQEAFGAAFGGIRTWVIANLPGFQTTLTEWGTAASQWIADAIPIIDAKLAEWWLAIDTFIATNLPTWQANLKAWGDAAWQWLQDAAGQLLITLGGWWLTISTYVSGQLPTWIATLKGWADAAWQWIKDAVPLVTTQIGQWGQALFNYVGNNLETWKANLLSWGQAAWQWIVDATSVLPTKIGEWYTELSSQLDAKLTEWKEKLGEWGAAFDVVSDAIDTIKDAWNKLVEIFAPSFVRLSESFATFIEDVQGLGDEFGELKDAASKALTALGEAFSAVWSVIGPILEKIGIAIGATIGVVAVFAINLLGSTFENLGDIIRIVINQATLIIDTLATVITETVNLVRAVIDGDWRSAWESFRAIANSAMSLVRGSINNLLKLAGEIGSTIYNAIVNTLEDLGLPDVKGKAEKIWQNIRDSAEDIFGVDLEAATPSSIFTTLGGAVIQGLIDGFWSKVEDVKTKIGEIKDAAIEKISGVEALKEWLGVGAAVIGGILKGLQENANKILDYLGGLAKDALDAVMNPFGIFGGGDAESSSVGSSSVMENVGQSIIGGWLNGMAGDDVPSRFAEISEDSFGTIADFWEMRSPSKLMERVGQSIMDGWVLGMNRNEHRILNAMQKISLSVSKIARRAGQDAINAYTGALGQFSNVGGNLIDRIAGTQTGDNIAKLITDEKGTLEFLQQQADIIRAVRDAGLDPSDVLAGLTLGRNADPLKLAGVVGRTMEELNRGLEQSLKNAASGLTRTIDEMRAGRKTIEDIEQEFTEEHLSVLGSYADRLAQIDEQIARAEEQTLRSGGGGMQHLKLLERQRNAMLAEVKEFHQQRVRLEHLLTTTPASDNQRAQEAMDRWRAQWLDPLVKLFETGDIFTRRSMWPQIQRRMKELQQFALQLPRITDVELRARQALEGFGQGAAGRVENLLTALYDPNQIVHLNANIAALNKFSQELHQIKNELNSMARGRPSVETITERVLGSFDQLQAYQNAIAAIDDQIARVEANVLQGGNIANLAGIQQLGATRQQREQDLETFLRQTKRLGEILAQVKNLSGPGQASAERFLQEMIQPITNAFSGPMRQIDREAWLRTADERVKTLNRFVDQMRQVERLQARVAGNQAFTHLTDDFALMQDMLMPENTRAGLIAKLDDYITQMMRLHEIQQDISQGRGINPIVERFASERLDSIARRLEDINMSEAERNHLIQQYRIEQEKILALQQKQQQLDFINQQMALVDQLRKLDDEEDWALNVDSIIRGIQFGVNASIDDLMSLTSRVLDELVRFANHKLGIASPSKVFARVGENIMAGLAMGVEDGLRMPMNALQRAAGTLVPYQLQQRALTINMGGVTINDRVDAALFENRIRQIVRNEFAG